MSLRRPKPKVVLAYDDDEEDSNTVAKATPMANTGFKKRSTVPNVKRKKLHIEFDDNKESDEEIEQPLLKMKQVQKRRPIEVPIVAQDDEMEVDEEPQAVYSLSYIEQLKSQNKIKEQVPKNTLYTVVSTGELAVSDQEILKRLQELKTREQYQEQKLELEDFIALEDHDEEFPHLARINKSVRDIDKHVEYEAELDENFAEDRLPLTLKEVQLQKQKIRAEMESAIEMFNEDMEEEQHAKIKNLGTVEEQLKFLDEQIEELNDVEEAQQQELINLQTKQAEISLQKTSILQKLDELAKNYL